jgi:hypothetical protein
MKRVCSVLLAPLVLLGFLVSCSLPSAEVDLRLQAGNYRFAVGLGAFQTAGYTVSSIEISLRHQADGTIRTRTLAIGATEADAAAVFSSLAPGMWDIGIEVYEASTLIGDGSGVVEIVMGQMVETTIVIALAGRPDPTPTNFGFEGGAIPAVFTSSGNADWGIDDTGAGFGLYSAKSGSINHNQTSAIVLSGTVPTGEVLTGISFALSVSSERNYDWLRFYVDGVQQERWSGSVAWTTASYTQSLAGGSAYEFRWSYTKDHSVDSGADAAWVDDISLTFAPETN